jgi:uncharacterized protein YuzB (UPF0349 family)
MLMDTECVNCRLMTHSFFTLVEIEVGSGNVVMLSVLENNLYHHVENEAEE